MRVETALRVFGLFLIAWVALAGLGQTANATVPGQNGSLLLEQNDSSRVSLFLANPVSGHVTDISPGANSYHAAFSPDGRDIAFIRNPGDQLWIASISGNEPARQLTFEPSGYDCCSADSPAFAPDGKSIFYSTETYGVDPKGYLEEVTVEGAGPNKFGPDYRQPDISPDGEHIAAVDFQTEYCGRGCSYWVGSSIHVLERDRSVETVVPTPGLRFARSPTYSPDGSRIVFEGTRPGEDEFSHIYSIKTDGTGLKQLTFGQRDESGPVYSPDGTSIAFGADYATWLVKSGGSKPRTVPTPISNVFPSDWQRKAPFVIKRFNPIQRKLKTRLFGPGRLVVRGAGIRTRTRTVAAGGLKSANIHLKRNLTRKLKSHRKVKVKLRVRFSPRGALPNTLRKTITLKHR